MKALEGACERQSGREGLREVVVSGGGEGLMEEGGGRKGNGWRGRREGSKMGTRKEGREKKVERKRGGIEDVKREAEKDRKIKVNDVGMEIG